MKELMVQGPGQLAWVEAPDPQLATPASALVRPIASASCDLDRRLIAGTTPFKPPFALGHECVAEVLEVGSASTVRPRKPKCSSSRLWSSGSSDFRFTDAVLIFFSMTMGTFTPVEVAHSLRLRPAFSQHDTGTRACN